MMVHELMKHMNRGEGDTELPIPVTSFRGVEKTQPNSNAKSDAEAIEAAIKTKGVDELKIIDVLTDRSNVQRRAIAQSYQQLYGKDMPSALKAALSGRLESVVLGLLKSPAEFDADELNWSMKGLGTDEETLIEILVSRSNAQLREIGKVYKAVNKVELEKDISSDTSGDFQKLLLALAKGNRDESSNIDEELVEQDARDLFAGGLQRKGTDVPKFISIFTSRSLPHLNRVFIVYKNFSEIDMEGTINKEVKGDLKDTFQALVKYIQNPPGFFADKLYESLKGGLKEKVLTRVMVSRCEIDMMDIRKQFKDKYGKSLYSFITAKTKGDYQKILLAMCGGDDL
ncbi:annexin A2 isoform X2 [Petromyzon marinus]|nr:annexin A2 isoform X2 [Petromyzon marinus]